MRIVGTILLWGLATIGAVAVGFFSYVILSILREDWARRHDLPHRD